MNLLNPAGDRWDRPQDSGVGRFFLSAYGVGGEGLLTSVPPQTLASLVATALVVINQSVPGPGEEQDDHYREHRERDERVRRR